MRKLCFLPLMLAGACSAGSVRNHNAAGDEAAPGDGAGGDTGGDTAGDNATCTPNPELCNGLDDDCNGTPDDGTDLALCPTAGRCERGACRLDGQTQWTRVYDTTEGSQANGAVLTAGGTVTVIGTYEGTVNFGGGDRASPAFSENIFILVLDAQGNWVSDREIDSVDRALVRGVSSDASGNILVAGQYAGSVDFGGGTRTSNGWDAFVMKLDGAGAYLWDHEFGGAGEDHARGVAADSSGNLYVTGLFNQTVDFGNGGRTSAGDADIYIVKLDVLGAPVWDLPLGGANLDYGEMVAVSGADVFVVGSCGGGVDFGGGSRATAGGFAIKLDTSGTYAWDREYATQAISEVAMAPGGAVVVEGWFLSPVDFGGGQRQSTGDGDVYVLELDGTGNWLWDHTFGGVSRDWSEALATDPAGAVLAAGVFQTSSDFGGGVRAAGGNGDVFAVRLNTDGTYAWDRTYGSNNWDYPHHLVFAGDGRVVMTGSVTRTLILNNIVVTRDAAFVYMAWD